MYYRKIRNPLKKNCFWDQESWSLESEIQLKESWECYETIGNRNPSCTNIYIETESTAGSPKLQDFLGFPNMGR